MSSNICALRKACLRVFALTATCFLLLGMRPVSAQTIGACVTQEGTCEWTPRPRLPQVWRNLCR
jgi:hypothetical protein